jgi:hypothetical protein
LAKMGLIPSPELRPPMSTISDKLKRELDRLIEKESI